jgi:hypothetical protein
MKTPFIVTLTHDNIKVNFFISLRVIRTFRIKAGGIYSNPSATLNLVAGVHIEERGDL